MVNKVASSLLTGEQQYFAIEQALTRAGYDHEAYIEERPKISHGSLVFSMLNASVAHSGFGPSGAAAVGGYQPLGADRSIITGGRMGGMSTAASSMYGSAGSNGLQMYSPVSPSSFSHRRYASTVRSSTSSILSLGRQKAEPPVVILPHYNSPYEAVYFNQPDIMHFVGKDLRIGTICISAKQGRGVMHFLVRTVLKFANVDIQDEYRSSTEFDQRRSLYPKKNDLLPMLHVALEQCLESIPESEVNRHQVVRHQAAADHSVFVLDDPGWLQSPRYISNLVRSLEEIRQEDFSVVLKNLEAQMRPAALTLDVVIPNSGEAFDDRDQEKFWTFFNGLGDHIEAEAYLPHVSTDPLNMPTMVAGDKTEEQRLEALHELIETETSYHKRMQDLVGIYLKEARDSASSLNPALGKYEIRVIFSNIEQIVAASSEFLKDLLEYRNGGGTGLNLGDICRKNLQVMGCYKQYLMRYKRAQETHSALIKKSPVYKALQERCIHSSGVQTLSNLLIEPTQRIVKYPLLFKAVLSGTREASLDVEGLREAAQIASQIAHMEKAKPEQRAEMLFNLRSIIENCPDSLLSQNRSIVSYLDGYETNLLTGERGRPITIILFTDKVMIVRRPKGLSGELLLQLKEDEEHRKRKEKEDKERERRHRRDSTRSKKDVEKHAEEGAGSHHHSSGIVASGFGILRKDWKFMGWIDLLKLKVAVVEQTDPEGLFCITTRSHAESKDDLWETTRGIMPDALDKRDAFISKFYETLSLAKAAAVSSATEFTSRLHVAELEVFCNVFTESQYRDFKFKGEVSLFYANSSNHPVDVTPFTRLPLFVGMIQASAPAVNADIDADSGGFRVVLRSKTTLNGVGESMSTAEDANKFLDTDAFQIHISELVANLQWTSYSFDPYQSAQLHFSRVYLDTDYLYKTASTFSKAATLRTKGLKKLRDSTARPSSSSSSGHYQAPPGYHHRYNDSFSPLTSPCDTTSMPSSPRVASAGGSLGRSNSIVSYNNGHQGYNGGKGDRLGSAMPPTAPQKRFSMPVMMRRKRADSTATNDSTDSDSSSTSQPPPIAPQLHHQHLAASTLRNSVSVMNLLIPGPGRKKDDAVEPIEWISMLIQRLETQGLVDSLLLDELSVNDLMVVRKLRGLINNAEIELLRLELLNYSSVIAFEILRVYLEENFEAGPFVSPSDIRSDLGMCLQYQRNGRMPEFIIQQSQTFLESMRPSSRIILGAIVSSYSRLQDSGVFEHYAVELAIKFCSLLGLNDSLLSPEPEIGIARTQDMDKSDNDLRESLQRLSMEEEQFLLMDIWMQYFPSLWPDLMNLNYDEYQEAFGSYSDISTPTSPVSPLSPSETLYSFSSFSPYFSAAMQQLPSTSLGAPPPSSSVVRSSSLSARHPQGEEEGSIVSRISPPASLSDRGADEIYAIDSKFLTDREGTSSLPASSMEGATKNKVNTSAMASEAGNDVESQGRKAESSTINRMTRTEDEKRNPSEILNMAFLDAMQARDEIESMAAQTHRNVGIMESQIEKVRDSITDSYKWISSRLLNLIASLPTSTISSPITTRSNLRNPQMVPSSAHQLVAKTQASSYAEDTSPQLHRQLSLSSIVSDLSVRSVSTLSLQESGYEPDCINLIVSKEGTPGLATPNTPEIRTRVGERPLPLTPIQEMLFLKGKSLNQQGDRRQESNRLKSDPAPEQLKSTPKLKETDGDGVKSTTTRDVQPPLMLEEYANEDEDEDSHRSRQVNSAACSDSYPKLTSSGSDALSMKLRVDHQDTHAFDTKSDGEPGSVLEKLGATDHQAVDRLKDMVEQIRLLQDQVSLTAERELESLNQCVGDVVGSGRELRMQCELISRRNQGLLERLASATAYQAKLGHEKEAIMDMCDEVVEENNVIFETFNMELEGIFAAVYANVVATEERASVQEDVKQQDLMPDRSKNDLTLAARTTTLPIKVPAAAPQALHQQRQAKQAELGSSPPLPPLPVDPFEQDTDQHKTSKMDADEMKTEAKRDITQSQEEVRKLLQRAIQDRWAAEQEARRAKRQASFFRGLLEKHGIVPDVDAENLFQ